MTLHFHWLRRIRANLKIISLCYTPAPIKTANLNQRDSIIRCAPSAGFFSFDERLACAIFLARVGRNHVCGIVGEVDMGVFSA